MSAYRPGSTYQLQHEVMLSVLHGPYSLTLFEACANATESCDIGSNDGSAKQNAQTIAEPEHKKPASAHQER